MGLLSWIIVGGIAGWLASMVMKTDASMGLIANIVVGIIGGLVGGWLLGVLGLGGETTGINLGSILTAFIGAVVFIFILKLITGRK